MRGGFSCRKCFACAAGFSGGIIIVLLCIYALRAEPFSPSLLPDDGIRRYLYIDRYGERLSVTYENDFNYQWQVDLEKVPEILLKAFIVSEDSRFFSHPGFDPLAIAHAFLQNLSALRVIRGGSTISEQVVRIFNPRVRTVVNRGKEIIDAIRLERDFTKNEILRFYLNQVPYARNRRGILQASRDFFDRDLSTLSVREMIALAVIVRAPDTFLKALEKGRTRAIEARIENLGRRLFEAGVIDQKQYGEFQRQNPVLKTPPPLTEAGHFVRFIESGKNFETPTPDGRIYTSLDASLQKQIQSLLDSRLTDLEKRGARNGAVLVVDNESGEALAWVNGHAGRKGKHSFFDGILTPRQPGSTLKPFLYALALEKGWTPATVIEDNPLFLPVGAGLKEFRNYSGRNYGPVRLREALGNSLNIPAVETIRFVGAGVFLSKLKELGFASLQKEAGQYGDGLALGNGEVTLFELVQAYSALAGRGVFRPITLQTGTPAGGGAFAAFSPEITSITGHILSDPDARTLEFGPGSLLNFPTQTAVKTGTSTDYTDAWAVGYSARYTCGVWLGNFEREPMNEVTGANGAAILLRGVFAGLELLKEPKPLYFTPMLEKKEICRAPGEDIHDCARKDEWFVPGTGESREISRRAFQKLVDVELPSNGLHLAEDPRIPDSFERFPFRIRTALPVTNVEWTLNGKTIASTGEGVTHLNWQPVRGKHEFAAVVSLKGVESPVKSGKVRFYVR